MYYLVFEKTNVIYSKHEIDIEIKSKQHFKAMINCD